MNTDLISFSSTLSSDDRADLRTAVQNLETISLAARLTNLLGKELNLAASLLPGPVRSMVGRASTLALRTALSVAMRSLGAQPRPASRRFHKAIATLSGAAGGAFGLMALPVELPASTLVILRSIADIARSEGEDLGDPEVLLSCLEVFALGGRSDTDDQLESGYFAARTLFAHSVSEAARFLAQRGIADEAAPAFIRLIAELASRYGIVVSQKAVAQATPILGALGGAAINYAFADHFQAIAHGHFTVRRLERIHGEASVHAEYERIRVTLSSKAA